MDQAMSAIDFDRVAITAYLAHKVAAGIVPLLDEIIRLADSKPWASVEDVGHVVDRTEKAILCHLKGV